MRVFDTWFSDTVKGQQARGDCKTKHYIPNTIFLITNFDVFFEQRKGFLRSELKRLLDVA
jgi:hypothetical protein